MSSPVAVKFTRPVPPCPKDYHTSVTELERNDLLRSTLTDEVSRRRVTQNLPALRIQILLETHPLPGVPGAYGDFETDTEV